ncbi:hypothetical protein ACEE25_13750 [Clostridium perfringens]
MKKSDLKDGMILESVNGLLRMVMGNNLISERGFLSLDNFDENLESSGILDSYTIDKVYRASLDKCYHLDDIFNKSKLDLIWVRPKEINWTKIPKWTKVLVKDKDEREYQNAYFMGIDSENGETQFGVTFYDMFIFADRCGDCEFEYFDCCKLHPLEKAKEDWYK